MQRLCTQQLRTLALSWCSQNTPCNLQASAAAASTLLGSIRGAHKRAKADVHGSVTAVLAAISQQIDLPSTAAARISQFLQRQDQRDSGFVSGETPSLSPEQAHATVSFLTTHLGLSPSEVADIFSRHPALLLSTVDQQLQPLTTYLQSTLAFTPAQIRDAVLKRPDVLLVPPSDLEATIAYFATMDIPAERLAAAMATHPPIITARLDDLMNNLAFLLGSNFTKAEVSGMLAASPRWLTLPITELTAKWKFFHKQMKGRQMDLVLWPQLLERDLLNTLGPRTGFAKKKRLKLLMPSYCWGHPLLQDRTMWRDNMVVPVLWYMTAAPAVFCDLFGLSLEEYMRYKRCWILTEGQQWRKQLYGTSLTPAEAFTQFREGLG